MADNPTHNPLAPPTVDGTEITVDQWLNTPTRVQRLLADMIISNDDFFLGEIFATLTNVQGGSVLYDPVLRNSLYAEENVQEIEPGQAYPLLTTTRGEPLVARVRKFGGMIYITDEARKRNNTVVWERETTKLTNTLALQLNSVGVAVLNAAIADTDADTGGRRQGAGGRWMTARGLTPQTTAPSGLPHADFAAIKKRSYDERQGVKFSALILNPQEDETLDLVYGDRPGGVQAMLDRYGIARKFVTSQQAAGTAKFVGAKQVGGFGTEEAMSVTSIRKEELDRTDLKAKALPVVWADNRWAIYELTGLDR